MPVYHPYTIFPLGDSALLIDFGNVIDEEVNRRVLRLFRRIQAAPHPGLTDLIPAYSSLTICYDALQLYTPEATAFDRLSQWIESLTPAATPGEEGRRHSIPVCYTPRFGPDLESLARQCGLTVPEVIERHTARTYRVYMIGFLPGFAYMGTVDGRLTAPRRSSPRPAVAAGSVGIAGEQTGIYPLEAPGGWQLVGRTPMTLFRRDADPPALLAPGDRVEFYSITEDEFTHYQDRTA